MPRDMADKSWTALNNEEQVDGTLANEVSPNELSTEDSVADKMSLDEVSTARSLPDEVSPDEKSPNALSVHGNNDKI